MTPRISCTENDVLKTSTSTAKLRTICRYRTEETLPAFSSLYETFRNSWEKNPSRQRTTRYASAYR